jgi:hypothetical protein
MSESSMASSHCLVTSDIAQFCLPQASRDANQKFAYVSSICFAFLVIGMTGVKTPRFVQKPLPEIIEYMPVDIVNPPVEQQPPAETAEQTEMTETPPDTPSDAPVIATVVASNPSAVAFAVPVEGPVIFRPAKYAGPPPAVLPRPRPAPVAAPKPQVVVFSRAKGGTGGYHPLPSYISGTLPSGASVVAEFLVKTDTNGVPIEVEVQKTSGSLELDRRSAQFIKTRWKMDASESLLWLAPIEFNVK